MRKEAFAAIRLAAENLRDALRLANAVKRKYPAGVEMLLTPKQYEILRTIEGEIEAATKEQPQ